MTRSDLEIANDYLHRWVALTKERRARLGRQIPVAAVQAAALRHPDVEVRRLCLFLLDHYASEASSDTFRRALRDPVASVREGALHGLACERCRHEEICVPDVVTDLVETLTSDGNAEVRHKAVAALARFVGRDARASESVARVARHDPDSAVRAVAQSVVDSGEPHVRRRKSALRDLRRASRKAVARSAQSRADQ
jgi:HEAT repeat protein